MNTTHSLAARVGASLILMAFAPALSAQVTSPAHHDEIEASYQTMMNAARAGDFAKARALVLQAVAWEPQNPKRRYEFAVVEALIAQKEIEAALGALDQAVKLGYDRDNTLETDPDLAALRGDSRFARLVAAARANAATPNIAVAAVAPAAAAPNPLASSQPAPRAAAPAALGKTDKPAPASFKTGVPVGLYFMTRYWSYTHTLEKSAWYFAPDGTVYENLEQGFSAADLAAHRGREGTARVNGGKLSVRWANGETETESVERDGSGFAWDMGIFTPVQPFVNATEIAGVYDGGESVAHGGNAVAVAKRLELHADGTFRWEGVSFAGGAINGVQLYAGAGASSVGTWTASGYSITLADATGKTFRGIAFPFDVEGKTPGRPDHLFFAGIMYKR